jgi:hypothetical protein
VEQQKNSMAHTRPETPTQKVGGLFGGGRNDVAAILMRRIALEQSDSDEDCPSDEEGTVAHIIYIEFVALIKKSR